MTAEPASAVSDADAVLLWPEEVARLIGPQGVEVTTVTQYLKEARRAAREGRRDEYMIPEPVPDPDSTDPWGRWRRQMPGGKDGTVVVNSNRWLEADILGWLERRPHRPPARRARDAKGKFSEKS